jgi:hypothetical protein
MIAAGGAITVPLAFFLFTWAIVVHKHFAPPNEIQRSLSPDFIGRVQVDYRFSYVDCRLFLSVNFLFFTGR